MAEDTVFAKIIRGEIPSSKVYETDNVYAFRDINPVAPVHVLVVPKQAITNLAEASDNASALLGELLTVARKVAEQEGIADAYRIVINNGAGAGQTVFHLHLHVLGGRGFAWPPG